MDWDKVSVDGKGGVHEPSFQTVETGFQPTPDLLRVEAKVDRIIQLLQKMQGGTNETEF